MFALALRAGLDSYYSLANWVRSFERRTKVTIIRRVKFYRTALSVTTTHRRPTYPLHHQDRKVLLLSTRLPWLDLSGHQEVSKRNAHPHRQSQIDTLC